MVSDGAQPTLDKRAGELLAYIVESVRALSNGMMQLVASASTVVAGISGPKPFPVNNDAADISARKGNGAPAEMASAALAGGSVGAAHIQEALSGFRDRYRLDDAFALRNDKRFGKIAYLSAQAAVTAYTADDSYKRANASMERINKYITALETSTELKTSVDINTRVMIEVAQQLNETLRTQAAIASVAGSYVMVLGSDSAEPDSARGLLNDINK
ncbi:type IV secretion system protein [Bradyrhizobium sp. Leo121]|uniref:type IV secretion system protein n=1 Tax=Bradyrhizobium sp. Leo121 TaxID=1571195 RepID=UPI0013EEEED5|nr:type IV secretion system protein [Bradyrhizobium sp. Leo121]